MDKKYTCYCGLYCGNCAVKVKVEPASKILYEEMKKAGFEEIIHLLPDGNKFWSFLKGMAIDGVCISCEEGSGDSGCKVRMCAKERNIELCTLCKSYPCEYFTDFFKRLPILKQDNELLCENGFKAWAKLQDERRVGGFVYTDTKNGE